MVVNYYYVRSRSLIFLLGVLIILIVQNIPDNSDTSNVQAKLDRKQ